jgi:hypothetical protein
MMFYLRLRLGSKLCRSSVGSKLIEPMQADMFGGTRDTTPIECIKPRTTAISLSLTLVDSDIPADIWGYDSRGEGWNT